MEFQSVGVALPIKAVSRLKVDWVFRNCWNLWWLMGQLEGAQTRSCLIPSPCSPWWKGRTRSVYLYPIVVVMLFEQWRKLWSVTLQRSLTCLSRGLKSFYFAKPQCFASKEQYAHEIDNEGMLLSLKIPPYIDSCIWSLCDYLWVGCFEGQLYPFLVPQFTISASDEILSMASQDQALK